MHAMTIKEIFNPHILTGLANLEAMGAATLGNKARAASITPHKITARIHKMVVARLPALPVIVPAPRPE